MTSCTVDNFYLTRMELVDILREAFAESPCTADLFGDKMPCRAVTDHECVDVDHAKKNLQNNDINSGGERGIFSL